MNASDEARRKIQLRDVAEGDLPIFFEHQLDAAANLMAAFTAADPTDRDAFMARWARILADEASPVRTIVFGSEVVGHILLWTDPALGEPEVSYWVGREYWGRGIATAALAEFVAQVRTRPLYARAAGDNLGSLRVLEKCGFELTGIVEKGFANARGEEIDEVVLKLER